MTFDTALRSVTEAKGQEALRLLLQRSGMVCDTKYSLYQAQGRTGSLCSIPPGLGLDTAEEKSKCLDLSEGLSPWIHENSL